MHMAAADFLPESAHRPGKKTPWGAGTRGSRERDLGTKTLLSSNFSRGGGIIARQKSPPNMADEFAYKRDSKLQERLSREIEVLVKQPGNTVCADCDETKRIRFCSVTLGVFLCNRCYGQHRQLGAHVTRGKCLGLDAWKPEEIELLRAIGNTKANARYEANLPPPPWKRPTTASTEREVLAFIKDKYERQKFAAVQFSGTVASMPAAVAAAKASPKGCKNK